jgi:hypothetical protein
MASEAQIAANRRNAQRATGPRSAAGKARVAQNATRHGLASQSLFQGPALERVRQLTEAFLGQGPRTPAIEDAALEAAEAQYVVERTRLARSAVFDEANAEPRPIVSAATRRARHRAQRLVEKVPADVMGEDRRARFLNFFAEQDAIDATVPVNSDAERHGAAVDARADRLQRLDRYERRALSRRCRALADLDELRRATGADAAEGGAS